MYEILLPAHNLLRWVFLAAALYTIFRAMKGSLNQSPFGKDDNTAGAIFLASAHTQLLVGLILWFISNPVQTAMADMAASMHNPETRKLLLEHPLTMIIAVAIIQIGRIKSKKAYADLDKHKRCLWYYSIALILVLIRIPWGVPMFRF